MKSRPRDDSYHGSMKWLNDILYKPIFSPAFFCTHTPLIHISKKSSVISPDVSITPHILFNSTLSYTSSPHNGRFRTSTFLHTRNLHTHTHTHNAPPTITIRRCGHIFHPMCLITWLEDHSTCPMCRDKLFKRMVWRKYAEIPVQGHGERTVELIVEEE
jgi:hypothetical protein